MINNLVTSVIRGNLYGVITPDTNIQFNHKVKGMSHIQKWESTLRSLIRDTYELPTWTKVDVLHTLTGVLPLRLILLQESISKMKRWRLLLGQKSPLRPEEKQALAQRLNNSTLVTKITALLKVENPLLPSTDWNSITTALRLHIQNFWKDIRSKTPNVSSLERGSRILNEVGFQGWKLHTQWTVSRLCPKPDKAPDSYRSKCPGCHTSHKDFSVCLKKLGLRKKRINSRLSFLLLALKRVRRIDLVGKWEKDVMESKEWLDLPSLLQRSPTTNRPRS